MKLKNNKGFTGVDIAVSTVILIVFISLITTMFYNLSVTSKKIERKTTATNLAIQTIEAMKVIEFEELTETMTIQDINNLLENKIEIPNGYEIKVDVNNTIYPDVIKIISTQINYLNGKNTENVRIETLVKNLNIKVEIPGIYVTLYTDGTLGFSNNEQPIDGKTILKSYGNIAGKTYNVKTEVPWYDDRENILNTIFVSKVSPVSTAYWFDDCSQLEKIININNLDISKVTSMTYMFANCTKLSNIDVSAFDTSNVNNMQGLFYYCLNLEKIDVSKWNTSSATSMSALFMNCKNLKNIDVSNFDTSKVTNMNGMFHDDYNLTQINVSNFDTKKVVGMNRLFFGCTKLEGLDLTKWDTSKVEDMGLMFMECNSLVDLDLTSFNTQSLKNSECMFKDTNNLKNIYVSSYWKISSQVNTTEMFLNCGTSTVTYK